MSTQARASQWDHRLYNVNRDVAHNFGDVMREVSARLEDRRWPALVELLQWEGITQDDLGKACEAFCLFVLSAADHKRERMDECLTRSGWDDVPAAAQVGLMAVLGTVLAGYFWVGCREATMGGVGPCLTYQDLRERGRLCSQMVTQPWWKRWLRRKRSAAGRIWDAIRGRTYVPGQGILAHRPPAPEQPTRGKKEGVGQGPQPAAAREAPPSPPPEGTSHADAGDAGRELR